MFEKEAEEYISANNLEWELECHRESPIREVNLAYQEGAEFGYNKAKGELEEDAKAIAKENAELKEKLDKIRKYLVYDIFDRFKYLENLLKISQEKQEELSKCIIEQQKTTGSLTDIIYELKAQIDKM